MTSPTQKVGLEAEEVAWQFLKRRGFKLLDRNYNTRRGELDMVVTKDDSLVFVEVRFRKRLDYGTGAESIDWRKQQKLIHTAEHYLQFRVRNPGRYQEIRFDVLSLGPGYEDGDGGEASNIEWIQNAFTL